MSADHPDAGTIEDEDIPDHINERIAYEPTDAELEAADADDVHADRVQLDVSLGDAHKTVRERVEAVVDAAEKNGVLQEIRIERAEGKWHSVSINIDALENWNVSGQSGLQSAHVLLGSQGGLHRATVRSSIGTDRTLEDFDSLLYYVEQMN